MSAPFSECGDIAADSLLRSSVSKCGGSKHKALARTALGPGPLPLKKCWLTVFQVDEAICAMRGVTVVPVYCFDLQLERSGSHPLSS